MKMLIVLLAVSAASASPRRLKRHAMFTEAEMEWLSRSKRWDDKQDLMLNTQKRLFIGDWINAALNKAKIVAGSLTHGIYPGTKWCGNGNIATNYDDLGTGSKKKVDICCREHDHCPESIPAESTEHGVTNNQFYTMSACSCDRKFRNCLKGNDDFTSDAIGTAFFNILNTSCFEDGEIEHNSFEI